MTRIATYFDSVFFFGCSQLLGRESPESGKVLEVPLFWSGEISLCADLQLNLLGKSLADLRHGSTWHLQIRQATLVQLWKCPCQKWPLLVLASMGFFMPGWIWRNLFHHLLLVDRSSRRLSVDTVDTGHLKTRFLILHLAVIQSWAHFPCLPGPLPPLAGHATCFHVQECWFLNSAIFSPW